MRIYRDVNLLTHSDHTAAAAQRAVRRVNQNILFAASLPSHAKS
jgi:hypothetical protein